MLSLPNLDHCTDLVAEGDEDRHLSALTAPEADRAVLMVIYAANLEIARAPWSSSESLIGQMRLQFWADALDGIEAGAPARQQPVLEALAALKAERGLSLAPLREIVAARQADLVSDPLEPAEFDEYLDVTGGGVMRFACRALDAPAEEAATALGRAAGLANLLRALPELAARGFMPLPGTGPDDRVALSEGRTTEHLSGVVRALAADARESLTCGRRAARQAPARALPALRAGWRAGRLLDRATRPGVDVIRDLGDESEFARRMGLFWRTLLGRA